MAEHDQDLLQQLGRRAAERLVPGPEEADLVALCEGELSPEAQAELLQRAEGDPDLMLAAQAYQPLDQGARRRIANRVADQLRDSQPVTQATPRKRRSRWWQVPALGAPLAAAAALVLWLMVPVDDGGSVDALPSYSLHAQGGIRVERGAAVPDQPQVYDLAPHGRLTLVARPDTVVEEHVTAELFARVGTNWKRVAAQAHVSDAGAVRVVARAKVLARTGVRGRSRVCLVVARPRRVEAPADLLDGSDTAGQGWQRFCVLVGLQR